MIYKLLSTLFSSTYLFGVLSHQPLAIHWWLSMSLDVGPQLLMDKPLRKCLIGLGALIVPNGFSFREYYSTL